MWTGGGRTRKREEGKDSATLVAGPAEQKSRSSSTTTTTTTTITRRGHSSTKKSSLAAPPSSSASSASSPWVASCFDRNCNPWRDTAGNRIEAHGGGLLRTSNGTFFWYGESKKVSRDGRSAFSRGDRQHHDCGFSMGVNAYSSASLGGPWTFVGMVFPQSRIKGVPGLGDGERPYIVERPKVVANRATGRFVLWFHLDRCNNPQHDNNPEPRQPRYSFRHAGVAVADRPEGPFRFVHALQPDGLESLDLQLFQEPDDPDRAYLIRSVKNAYVGISPLSRDFLTTAEDHQQPGRGSRSGGRPTSTISPALEGMAVFRFPYATERDGGGSLFAIMSHLTGWEPNPLVMLRAQGGLGNTRSQGGKYGPAPASDQQEDNNDDEQDYRGNGSADDDDEEGDDDEEEERRRLNPLLQSLAMLRKKGEARGEGGDAATRPWWRQQQQQQHREPTSISGSGSGGSSSSSRSGGGSTGSGSGSASRRGVFPSLGDPSLSWTDLGNPTRHFRSHNAQPTFVFSASKDHGGLIDKRSGRSYALLMADNWLYAGPRGLRDAGYIWLPIEFGFENGGGSGGTYTARVRRLENWSMDDPFS